MVLDTMPPFSKSGLQVLAGEYLAGPLLKWDDLSLFDQLFAAGSEPEMSVLAWELSELLCTMVIVVGAGSPNAYLLRAVLAPEFAWFGLHRAGMSHPGKGSSPIIEGKTNTNLRLAQVPTNTSDLLNLLHSHPLAASVALHQNLGVGDQWKPLVGRLWAHFEPYGSNLPADNDLLPRMEEDFGDVLPMEGVEFVSVSGVYMDTMIRDISPEMDVCVEPGEVSASDPAAPMTVPASSAAASSSTNKYRQRY